MSTLWSLDDVSLITQRTTRLESISVDIPTGVTAVLGFSGAGKTSLLNLLVGFEQPAKGAITTKLPTVSLPCFWVPQNGGLWNHVTTADHIALVNQTEVRDWLERFDLSSRATSKPAELSQGERARLSVARALATDASVLVMDEPLAHVDPGRVAAYFDVVFERIQSKSRSLIFATHQPELVLRYARHVICLDNATCVFSGGVNDLYENPTNSKLASLLGPGNWLSSDEFSFWLDQKRSDGVLRPERLRLAVIEESPLSVVSSRSIGSYTETVVSHKNSQRERRFVHQTGPRLNHGQFVSMIVSFEDCDRGGE